MTFINLRFLHLLCAGAKAAGNGGFARAGWAGLVGGKVRWLMPARA